MTRPEKAKELFENGYNCAQAVFCAFGDVTGFEHEAAIRFSAGFGGGMGRLREVCGAVSGMTMVLSCVFASADPNDAQKKKELYALIQRAAGEFKAKNGSYVCRELLGPVEGASGPVPEARTVQYYKKRPCSELVKSAAEITEKILAENK